MHLIPARFDPQAAAWQEVAPSPPAHRALLRCATFNVWFDDFAFERRAAGLLELLERCDADVIALQEVTPRLLELILDSAWVRAGYAISDQSGASVWPYGALLLTRWAPTRLGYYALPSTMGRALITAELVLNGHPIVVSTVHLESLRASAAVRGAQLDQIFAILEDHPHAMLMGDFNFCASWEDENRRLDPEYLDLWPALRPREPGYTEDTAVNIMRLNDRGRHKQVRFDRVLLRSRRPGWAPATIRLLGNTPLGPDAPELFPSDHFGLCAELRWEGASA